MAPSNALKKVDGFPLLGMNTVDNPSVLKEGECKSLVNAFPGTPPFYRKGCKLRELTWANGHTAYMPLGFMHNDDIDKIILWIYDPVAKKFVLRSIDYGSIDTVVDDSTSSNIGEGTFSGDYPEFDLVFAHNNMYCFISELFKTWEPNVYHEWIDIDIVALGNKVIEEDGGTVRDMCITHPARMNSLKGYNEDGGGMEPSKYYSYTFTYVRRKDAEAYEECTPEEDAPPIYFIYPPDIKSKIKETISYMPKDTSVFMPGAIEGISLSEMYTVQLDVDKNAVLFDLTGCDGYDYKHVEAIMQGATHIRIFRSMGFDSEDLAKNATHYFVADIGLNIQDYTYSYVDTLSDASLSGEFNTFFMDQYDSCPAAKYGLYHKNRMWIYGIVGQEGMGYYSEEPGGDEGTDLELANKYPQKYASMFKLKEYYVNCESGDGIRDTGIARLGDDIYFFKETKTFALYGGDPNLSTVQNISDDIGCILPNTITYCNTPMFGKCILFMSHKGPYVLREGGIVQPFTEFKIYELWPDKNMDKFGELISDFKNYRYHIINNCSAGYFNNTWWIFYKTNSGVNKMYGYYFNEDLLNTESAPHGPMKFEFAYFKDFNLKGIAIADTGTAEATILVTKEAGSDNTYAIGKYLGAIQESDSHPFWKNSLSPACVDIIKLSEESRKERYWFEYESKNIYMGPESHSFSELYSLTALCQQIYDYVVNDGKGLNYSEIKDDSLDITVYGDSERYKESVSFDDDQVIQNSQTSKSYDGECAGATGGPIAQFDLDGENIGSVFNLNKAIGWRAYLYNSDSPYDGTWYTVIESDGSSTTTFIVVDTDISDLTCNRVKFSPILKMRQFIEVYPKADFYSTFFRFKLRKLLPVLGEFKLLPVTLAAIPVNLDAEFIAGMGDITNGWEE